MVFLKNTLNNKLIFSFYAILASCNYTNKIVASPDIPWSILGPVAAILFCTPVFYYGSKIITADHVYTDTKQKIFTSISPLNCHKARKMIAAWETTLLDAPYDLDCITRNSGFSAWMCGMTSGLMTRLEDEADAKKKFATCVNNGKNVPIPLEDIEECIRLSFQSRNES